MRPRSSTVSLAFCAALFACGSSESAAQSAGTGPGASSEALAPTPGALRGWARATVAAPADSTALMPVEVGPLRVRRTLGLPASGRPAISSDGGWVVWSSERGVTVRDVRSGAMRAVPIPAGMRAQDAALFGTGELGVSMSQEGADGTVRRLLVVYEVASLRVTHALSTTQPYDYCSLVLGSPRELLCIVDRASETDPSYVLAVTAGTHLARTIPLTTTSGISEAVVSVDGAHLYYSAGRSVRAPAAVVGVDLTTGRSRSFPAPVGEGDYVTGLAITPSETHLAIGTFGGSASLHELPSGRRVRSAEPYGGERQTLGVSDDLALWDHRDHLTMHPRTGPARRQASPCGSFDAIQVTATDVVTASYVGLCVHDRRTLALDLSRSMTFDGVRAFWRGEEISLVSSSLSTEDVAVPRVVRWNAVTGTLVGVEQSYAAWMSASDASTTLPPSFTGELAPGTPILLEISGDRAIATLPGESRPVLYDLAAGRTIAPSHDSAVFLSGGAELLEAAHDPYDATRSAGLVVRSSRDGALRRTIRPLTDYARVVLAPDERRAILFSERRAELVELADGRTTPLFAGSIQDAVFRPDGAELALSVFCDDGDACDTRILRFALPAGALVSMLESRERAILVYAPTNDALALVSPSGIFVQPLSRGWTAR